jgi:hypothetical protein
MGDRREDAPHGHGLMSPPWESVCCFAGLGCCGRHEEKRDWDVDIRDDLRFNAPIAAVARRLRALRRRRVAVALLAAAMSLGAVVFALSARAVPGSRASFARQAAPPTPVTIVTRPHRSAAPEPVSSKPVSRPAVPTRAAASVAAPLATATPALVGRAAAVLEPVLDVLPAVTGLL